jgi:hypothetical protein
MSPKNMSNRAVLGQTVAPVTAFPHIRFNTCPGVPIVCRRPAAGMRSGSTSPRRTVEETRQEQSVQRGEIVRGGTLGNLVQVRIDLVQCGYLPAASCDYVICRRVRMSNRAIPLGLLFTGLLTYGAQAADVSSPPSLVSSRLSGLEALQPDMPSSDLSSFIGASALIVIFADDPDDPDFVSQIGILRSRADDLAARNVVLLTDTAPAEDGPLRQALRPRGFSILLIDSTGTLAQRRRTVTDARRLIRQIDEMP